MSEKDLDKNNKQSSERDEENSEQHFDGEPADTSAHNNNMLQTIQLQDGNNDHTQN